MQTVSLGYKDVDGEVYWRDASYIQFLDEEGLKFQAYCHARKRRKRDYDVTQIAWAKDKKTYGWINPRNLVKLIKYPFFKGIDIEGKHCGLDDLREIFLSGNLEKTQLVIGNVGAMDDTSLFHLAMELKRFRKPNVRAFADEIDKIRIARDVDLEAVVDPSMADVEPAEKGFDRAMSISLLSD